MKKLLLIAFFKTALAAIGAAQVTVAPDRLTAYSQGATSAYLTFSNVVDLRPAEALWCGELAPAAPNLGQTCAPGTIFGQLPARYDQSRLAGARYTDIMSITPAVARRAYTDAAAGADARFFYVRRFVSTVGGPDQFVAVTIRLGGNGAGVPFSLTAVRLTWQNGEKIVPFIKPDEKLPAIAAEIRYTGTGRLKGRWEIVKPGEELPDRRDLLSEAALAPEERGTQRRYTVLSRFNVNLPPGGRYTLPGPENWRIDKTIEGMYVILFRVEASDAPDSVSGATPTGAVAGFPMPTLRYYVGNASNVDLPPATAEADDSSAGPAPLTLRWPAVAFARLYRLEIADEADAKLFDAVLSADAREYRPPSFIVELRRAKTLKWRVTALGAEGKRLDESEFKIIENGELRVEKSDR